MHLRRGKYGYAMVNRLCLVNALRAVFVIVIVIVIVIV